MEKSCRAATCTRRLILQGAAASGVLGASRAYGDPAKGWSAAGLAALKSSAVDMGLVAFIVQHRGVPVLSYGDIKRPCTIYSARKAFLSALYGQEVAKGVINLKARIGDLGIQDDLGLTDIEKSATIEDLLRARSGVYLPLAAGVAPASPGVSVGATRPQRGQYAPGTHWYYNNWDFNVLGNIYERLTRKDFFVALDHNIAKPLGMKDFDPYRDGNYYYVNDAIGGNTRYPNFRTDMSARDMALFGQLYLQRGSWKGKQIVPSDWVERSTQPYSQTGEKGVVSGYAYLWWTGAPLPEAPLRLPSRVYSAFGQNGHFIGVMPDFETVVVVQPDDKKPVTNDRYEKIIHQIAAAHPHNQS